jgi:hypothetical protein
MCMFDTCVGRLVQVHHELRRHHFGQGSVASKSILAELEVLVHLPTCLQCSEGGRKHGHMVVGSHVVARGKNLKALYCSID